MIASNRQNYIAAAVAVCLAATTLVNAAGALTETGESPNVRVRAVGLKAVRWTEGFWAQKFDMVRERSIPAMGGFMKGNEFKPYYQHFHIAAGEMEGRYRGAPSNDGDFYKPVQAACVYHWVAGRDNFLSVANHTAGFLQAAFRNPTPDLARPAGDWKGKLYRPPNDVWEQPVDVHLISYYAWSNRGESEISVWFPHAH